MESLYRKITLTLAILAIIICGTYASQQKKWKKKYSEVVQTLSAGKSVPDMTLPSVGSFLSTELTNNVFHDLQTSYLAHTDYDSKKNHRFTFESYNTYLTSDVTVKYGWENGKRIPTCSGGFSEKFQIKIKLPIKFYIEKKKVKKPKSKKGNYINWSAWFINQPKENDIEIYNSPNCNIRYQEANRNSNYKFIIAKSLGSEGYKNIVLRAIMDEIYNQLESKKISKGYKRI